MNLLRSLPYLCIVAFAANGCGGGGGASGGSNPGTAVSPSASAPPVHTQCTGSTASTSSAGITPVAPALTVPSGLTIQTIASVPSARELAALPNGDLLVGTNRNSVYIVPNAEGPHAAGAPSVFATIGDANADGVAFDPSSCTIFVGSEYHVWAIPYNDGDLTARSITQIASVRTGALATPPDDVHITTSVAVQGSTLYASMGSSCNGCTGETDPTRAAIWKMNRDGSGMTLVAKRIRNAIALAVDPVTNHLWAGVAGQDSLPAGHPYEFVDDVTAHQVDGVADYGWPYCEENHHLYNSGPGAPSNCNATVQPLVEFPAYITHVGVAFYPQNPAGAYALPQQYRGDLLVTSHGSWHTDASGCGYAPEVDAVAMNGDTPRISVNWSDPTAQYTSFVRGFQTSCTTRNGRPTGITVGSKGSVFVADDAASAIYRIRP